MNRETLLGILDNLYKQAATFGQSHSYSNEAGGQQITMHSLNDITQSIKFYESKLAEIDGTRRRGAYRMVQR